MIPITCTCVLANYLASPGLGFLYPQNGSNNISRKHTIHTSCFEQCLAHQKGLLSISCITFFFYYYHCYYLLHLYYLSNNVYPPLLFTYSRSGDK